MSEEWGDFRLFGGLRIDERLFAGYLSDFICCDERFIPSFTAKMNFGTFCPET